MGALLFEKQFPAVEDELEDYGPCRRVGSEGPQHIRYVLGLHMRRIGA